MTARLSRDIFHGNPVLINALSSLDCTRLDVVSHLPIIASLRSSLQFGIGLVHVLDWSSPPLTVALLLLALAACWHPSVALVVVALTVLVLIGHAYVQRRFERLLAMTPRGVRLQNAAVRRALMQTLAAVPQPIHFYSLTVFTSFTSSS